MFLRCSYFLRNLSLNVLINRVLIKKKRVVLISFIYPAANAPCTASKSENLRHSIGHLKQEMRNLRNADLALLSQLNDLHQQIMTYKVAVSSILLNITVYAVLHQLHNHRQHILSYKGV